jgi:hypothetical protein
MKSTKFKRTSLDPRTLKCELSKNRNDHLSFFYELKRVFPPGLWDFGAQKLGQLIYGFGSYN